MKRAFTLFELILIITLFFIIGAVFTYKYEENGLQDAANRLTLYLKETRYQALIDEKKNSSESFWFKKRWRLKFLRCRKDVGGIYYIIYSDKNTAGHASLDESLSDPLTNKKIYSTNKCESNQNTSKYVLLTKEFGIDEVNISCNSTSSLGQISFGNDGKIYSRLSNFENAENEHEIENPCTIELKSHKKGVIEVIIEPKTGYSYIKKSQG